MERGLSQNDRAYPKDEKQMKPSSQRLTIKDLPVNERPRERLAKYGAEKLSNSDLLAIILRSGMKGNTAIDNPLKRH